MTDAWDDVGGGSWPTLCSYVDVPEMLLLLTRGLGG